MHRIEWRLFLKTIIICISNKINSRREKQYDTKWFDMRLCLAAGSGNGSDAQLADTAETDCNGNADVTAFGRSAYGDCDGGLPGSDFYGDFRYRRFNSFRCLFQQHYRGGIYHSDRS